MSAYAIFKDNFFFGVGLKNYRVHCFKSQYNLYEDSCSTHPHNIPIQFLAETGIFGFLFYFFSFFYLIKNLSLFIFRKSYAGQKKNYLNLMLIPLLINLFPFLPSGNFFHNWLSVITYLPLAFYLFAINKR
jgi:O-antigen ligase